jgi:predicted RNase H-like HicB family nuclease
VVAPNMTRRVLLYPAEDGYLVAEVPSLPGCVSQGKTREEALANVREAISLHEDVLRERGEPVPERVNEPQRRAFVP